MVIAMFDIGETGINSLKRLVNGPNIGKEHFSIDFCMNEFIFLLPYYLMKHLYS